MPRCWLAIVILGVVSLSAPIARADESARIHLPSATSVEVQTEKSPPTTSSSSQHDPLRTRLPQRSKSSLATKQDTPKRRTPSSMFTVISSLAIVVGLFLLMAWLTRRAAPRASQSLPPDVVQVLGRSPLATRNMMQLVRVGNKLLLVSLSSQGATTLTEITDPAEVEQLAARCERSRPSSISATFRNVLHQFGEERTSAGFVGTEQRGS